MASASLYPELQDCTHFTTGIGLPDMQTCWYLFPCSPSSVSLQVVNHGRTVKRVSSCDTCGIAGASKVACNNKIPAASLGCAPLPAILYMSPGLFEGGSCGSLAAERCVFAHSRTLGMHIRVYTQVAQMPGHSHIHIQRGINARDQLQGLGYDREECQPRVVV